MSTAELPALRRLRVVNGFDVHPLVEGRALLLGGVRIEHSHGLDGHSDGDVVAHAVTDAVCGGVGLGDIGLLFPSSDASLEGADSMELLRQAVERVRNTGAEVLSVDVVVMAQVPHLAPHRTAIEESLAAALGLDATQIAVRATTTDHLGFVGRKEGIAALATATVLRAE